jgi:ribosomal protein L37AE/L43A
VLAQSNLLSILDEVLKQTALIRRGGKQAVYFCPECKHYKRKLEVNLETGQWHCWTCDIKGAHLGSLLYKVKASPKYRDQIEKLTGVIRQKVRNYVQKEVYLALPDEFHPLMTPLDSPEYKNAVHYLIKKRKFLKEDIIRYNIGYCESGEYDGHIIIPSYDSDGKLNFFIGRRYFESEGAIPYKKPEFPMNIVGFESFVNYKQPLNLCEGVFDSIAIRNNAVPLFGKYLQPKLLSEILIHNVKRVNMILDDDALDDAVENYRRLKRVNAKLDIHVIKLDGKDPSVLGYSRMHQLIKDSTPFEFEDLIAYKLKI